MVAVSKHPILMEVIMRFIYKIIVGVLKFISLPYRIAHYLWTVRSVDEETGKKLLDVLRDYEDE